MLLQNLKNM